MPISCLRGYTVMSGSNDVNTHLKVSIAERDEPSQKLESHPQPRVPQQRAEHGPERIPDHVVDVRHA
jgi:hypothetical protein